MMKKSAANCLRASLFGLFLSVIISCIPAPSPTPMLTMTPTAPPVRPLEQVLTQIRRSNRYDTSTPQDDEGRGIYPLHGQPDGRSETVYPPFVLGPRRQTDMMVRQLYLLMPAEVRRSTAFVITDRLAQNPDAYLPYLRSRQQVVILGNFVGIGEARFDDPWFTTRHQRELEMGEWAIQMAQALDKEVIAVRYTMGDSISEYAVKVRERLQGQLDAMLERYGLSALQTPINWGADEMAPVAMAALLPPLRVKVTLETEDCRHYWDGGKTTREVLQAKMDEMGLVWVEAEADFDFEVLVLTNSAGEDGRFPDPGRQRTLDEITLATFAASPADELQRSERRSTQVIIDGRMFNGAWDRLSAPPFCDYLAYGGWGTIANKAGLTLATAKILFYAQNPAAQRQLYLEAVAHDVFANGYRDGRDLLTPLLAEHDIQFDHWNGYTTVTEVTTVFQVLNDFVNTQMAAHFADTDCMQERTVRVTPQLWRTFESEVHLLPIQTDEMNVVGVYRVDLDPEVFDPISGASLHPLTLDDLVNEGTQR